MKNDDDFDPLEEHNQRIERGEFIDTPTRSLRGTGIVDPRDILRHAPEFREEHFLLLPEIFRNYVTDCCAAWGGDPGSYACGFLAMHCGALHSSVVMNVNPLRKDNWKRPNDFALLVGRSGDNKSGLWHDLTQFQEEWQHAMIRTAAVSAGAVPKGAPRRLPPACFLQAASIEGVMNQLADNSGERLMIGVEEAMGFYGTSAAHHGENSASVMTDACCLVYDGKDYVKRLVKKTLVIPSALATIITTTVTDKLSNWKAFPLMISSGLMGRHTVGVITRPLGQDEARLIPGATDAMRAMMLQIRGLRDVRFVLSQEAAKAWQAFHRKKDEQINELADLNVSKGVEEWVRKYEMRTVSMAVIFQAYEYIEGKQTAHVVTEELSTEADAGKVDGGKKMIRTVEVTKSNLQRAVRLIEGYIYPVQRFFYDIAARTNEFSKEIINFLAARLDNDAEDNRIIPRKELTHSGPWAVRGTSDAAKAAQRRWIATLLDFGLIETYEHPNQRQMKKRYIEEEYRWYRMNDEVYEFFADSREWFVEHNRKQKAVRARNGIGPDRPIELD